MILTEKITKLSGTDWASTISLVNMELGQVTSKLWCAHYFSDFFSDFTRQEGGEFYIFFDEDKDVWTETKYFFGATLFSRLENDNTNYCLESYNNWSKFNGTDMVFSEKMNVSCQGKGHLIRLGKSQHDNLITLENLT